jgi:hypothetical protein
LIQKKNKYITIKKKKKKKKKKKSSWNCAKVV